MQVNGGPLAGGDPLFAFVQVAAAHDWIVGDRDEQLAIQTRFTAAKYDRLPAVIEGLSGQLIRTKELTAKGRLETRRPGRGACDLKTKCNVASHRPAPVVG